MLKIKAPNLGALLLSVGIGIGGEGHILSHATEIFAEETRIVSQSFGFVGADFDFFAVFLCQPLDFGNFALIVELNGQHVAVNFFRRKKATLLMSEDI